MIGNPLEKISLEITNSQTINKFLELLLAFGLGMLAYALHGIMKNPIGIPGHHGLIFMGVLMTARLTTGNSASGTAAAIGTGSIILFGPLGLSDPFRIITYMLPGIALDLLFLVPGQQRKLHRQLLVAAFTGGLAYMTIPLVRIIMLGLTGLPYPAVAKYGLIIPALSFFLFGFVGGASGKIANKMIAWLSRNITPPFRSGR
jgi:hypothetical protein